MDLAKWHIFIELMEWSSLYHILFDFPEDPVVVLYDLFQLILELLLNEVMEQLSDIFNQCLKSTIIATAADIHFLFFEELEEPVNELGVS